MKWTNIRLIFWREVRDQLRDRRTLFTIAVLPIVLYPLMGMSLLQVTQFMQEHVSRVHIIGGEALPDQPPLVVGDRFALELCAGDDARLMQLVVDRASPAALSADDVQRRAEETIRSGEYDVVLYFPPGFASQLQKARALLRQARHQGTGAEAVEVPHPVIFVNQASDKSRISWERVEQVLVRWRRAMVHSNLQENNIPLTATEPFVMENANVAQDERLRAAMWSKVLPFILMIWALTGAFYPAVDLCAGEKERGTLETLLSSPATRPEIVWGKLLTVMVFSMATAVLNLVSMGVTGGVVMAQMSQMGSGLGPEIGPPPLWSCGWLLLALPLISALFSALSLAIAAFARSSKEGQYYLMPLLLIILPLMILPMLPAAELDLGTSLIPVTGMVMLLRALMEAQYREAMTHALPIIAVTLTCCFFAIRWAIDQFRNETVLFRESERWGLGLWLRHLMRDRGETPSFAEAVMCGVIILLARFFLALAVKIEPTFADFATSTLVIQIALIATPALLMAVVLTRSPPRTLLLKQFPRPLALPAAVLAALALHPVFSLMHRGIAYLYPISQDAQAALEPLAQALNSAPLLAAILVVALSPAICEELAFRGFILSGLRHMGHKWLAILLSSFFFGIAHVLLQQSLAAFVVGIVIGYIAVQTGSLLPGILFHFTHNALSILLTRVDQAMLDTYRWLGWLVTLHGAEGSPADQLSLEYNWTVVLGGAVVALGVLWWFRSLPYQQYAEETFKQALDHESKQLVANT